MEIEYAILPMAIMIYLIARKIQKRKKYSDARIMLANRTNQVNRKEECDKVVRFFQLNCNYLLADNFTRREIDDLLITQGISPFDLAEHIVSRIKEMRGLTLGHQIIPKYKLDVKVSQDVRLKHTHVLGKTGCGKTTLLLNMIRQDLLAGRGLIIVCYEYEMVDSILSMVPDSRESDVIYLNPADIGQPVSFNPLNLKESENIDVKFDNIYSIFVRLLTDTTSRMQEILRHVLYALIEASETTLLDVAKLLDNKNPLFRLQVINNLQNAYTKEFWEHTYTQYPNNAALPLIHRIGQFLSSVYCRTILCQRKNSLDIREIIDNGKILICNFSDGIIGESNARILGRLLVAQIQTALMSRADTIPQQRKPFFIYLDEFSQFIEDASYEQILRRARKYGAGLILSHQQIGQLPVTLLKDILGNVATLISFVVSRDDANKLSKEFILKQPDGQIKTVSPEHLLNLRVGETFCKINNHSFFMRTYPFDISLDTQKIERIKQASRQNYGVIPEKRETYQPDLTNVILNEPERVFN